VSPADFDHEAQRELEQRALRNVSWLARKLGYQDALDRRQEKWLMIGMGVALVAIVATLGVSAMRASSADEAELARNRCMVATQVELMPGMLEKVRERRPELTPARQQEITRAWAADEARATCQAKASAK
jgi:hypothetical protein